MSSPFTNSHFRISHAAVHNRRSGPDACKFIMSLSFLDLMVIVDSMLDGWIF